MRLMSLHPRSSWYLNRVLLELTSIGGCRMLTFVEQSPAGHRYSAVDRSPPSKRQSLEMDCVRLVSSSDLSGDLSGDAAHK